MIEVYIDGASKGNPGPSGAGVFIKGVQPPVQLSLPLGIMSNHEAEYHALLVALKYCMEHNYSIVSFRTDSQLVERAVEKEYAKNKTYAPLLEEALAYIKSFDLFFIKWIPNSQNKVADELARKAISQN
ncbi:ribonuclease HI [Bacillus pseudomycoides]|uniref:reverse transcriptase-like protein n=1 Tax=Bacillus pseudomycoides TaxID=64104 RepID=UPI0004ED8632|nr:reverse transcriptase-like protein [Bacillus pseudomycoides]AIK38731.1 14.7 kDa ribonuclease H-like protein [Bacillus pseudomycoides]AJI17395.1 14.7 kDa ribonuclease H-like protein [Bacillus pseudomycoides]PDY01424.1 ribonuclease HI [Bacillus pseudomycoides]PEK76864.1 ribonuclease HI [Bacillus pseudomycoides]PEN10779.1 ribonuclease HI [Bacillus pseudomycoides]